MISWASFIGQMKGPGITCISNMDPSQHQMGGSIKWVDPIFGHPKVAYLNLNLGEIMLIKGVCSQLQKNKNQVKHV